MAGRDINHCIQTGHVTRDCDLTQTKTGMSICKFGLAVNESVKNKSTGGWDDRPMFVEIVIFGAQGEAFAKFHSKGSRALIEGRLSMDQWDDKTTGKKRTKHYITADRWHFVGNKPPTPRASADVSDPDDGTMPIDETPF